MNTPAAIYKTNQHHNERRLAMKGEQWLRVADVAAEMGVSIWVVYGAIKRGELLIQRVSPKLIRISRQDLAAWRAGMRRQKAA
jgi:hypothetical protein